MILKNERNFKNFGYVFVTKFYITIKNFLGHFNSYSCKFLLKTIFKIVRKCLKNLKIHKNQQIYLILKIETLASLEK